jgi:dihydroorotate dehydrogenase (NAD+) catalytic subunit
VTDITDIARAAEDGGADALSLINTQIGMSIDLETRKPYLANKTGGLSGPAIKPIALHMVYQTARAVFLSAGATAIQIGTANFIDPGITMTVIDGIRQYCQDHAIQKVGDLKLMEE